MVFWWVWNHLKLTQFYLPWILLLRYPSLPLWKTWFYECHCSQGWWRLQFRWFWWNSTIKRKLPCMVNLIGLQKSVFDGIVTEWVSWWLIRVQLLFRVKSRICYCIVWLFQRGFSFWFLFRVDDQCLTFVENSWRKKIIVLRLIMFKFYFYFSIYPWTLCSIQSLIKNI